MSNVQKLYIDCEFNSFKGALISMAIVADDKNYFYEVLPCANPEPWVAQHVMPILYKDAVDMVTFQRKLQAFLSQFRGGIHIVADWPEDIKHFCDVLITGPGERMNTPPLTMEVVRVDFDSALPHNAFMDALGIWKGSCLAG